MPFKKENLGDGKDWRACTTCGMEGVGNEWVRQHKCLPDVQGAGPRYQSLHLIEEDARINKIVQALRKLNKGQTAAVCTDDEPKDKADRYLRKIITLCKEVRLKERYDGPTPGVVTLVFERT